GGVLPAVRPGAYRRAQRRVPQGRRVPPAGQARRGGAGGPVRGVVRRTRPRPGSTARGTVRGGRDVPAELARTVPSRGGARGRGAGLRRTRVPRRAAR